MTLVNSSDLKTDHAVRMMIVDDSAVIRNVMARVFENNPAFQVTLMAANGESAAQKLRETPVDVIILDIDMPIMDGLKAIPLLKAIDPAVQIIMASTLTHKNAEISLRALALGATDYIPKPSTGMVSTAALDFALELTEKVKALGALARQRGVRLTAKHVDRIFTHSIPAGDHSKKEITLRPEGHFRPGIIAIGASTGGPEALFNIIRQLGSHLPQPVIITQHMPATFTLILAEHISRQCHVVCKEGVDKELLKPGRYYLAPGDFHMVIVKSPQGPMIRLVQDPRENFCRPAVDPMLRSLPEIYGRRILVAILTGMGMDGLKGSEKVVAAGGQILAQDEASSIVWGMPGAVAAAGLCSAVLPLGELGTAIRKRATKDEP